MLCRSAAVDVRTLPPKPRSNCSRSTASRSTKKRVCVSSAARSQASASCMIDFHCANPVQMNTPTEAFRGTDRQSTEQDLTR